MYDSGRRRKVFELAFREYGGLVVRTRRPSYRGLLLLGQAEETLGLGLAATSVSGTARARAFRPAVVAFAESLLSWDLLDDGVPVPATVAGVESQDYALVVNLVLTWYQRVALRPVRLDEVPESDPATDESPTERQDDTDDLAAKLAHLPTFTAPVAESLSSSNGDSVTEIADSSLSADETRAAVHNGPVPVG